MKTKKLFYFDEEKEAEEIIKNGFNIQGIDYNKMYIIGKYFREKEKLNEAQLEKRIIDFCKKHNKYFNPVSEQTQIQLWVNSAMKYNLRKINAIELSENEIIFLKKIPNNRDRKLLFITLVFSKALKQGNTRRGKSKFKTSDKYYIRYSNFTDIIHLSQLSNISEIYLAKIFNKYKEHFIFYNAEKELIRLEFANPSSEKTVQIKNLNDLVKEYKNIFGENISYCSICGEVITKKSNRQMYCENCAKIERNKKQKELMQERRK